MNNDRADEIVRHFDVVAEGLESKIQIVAEGQVMIREELRAFRGEVASEFAEIRSMVEFS